jgi:hypothetical protein
MKRENATEVTKQSTCKQGKTKNQEKESMNQKRKTELQRKEREIERRKKSILTKTDDGKCMVHKLGFYGT